MTLSNKPVKLAVFVEQEIHIGGGFQQALNSVLLVNEIEKDICKPIFIVLHKQNVNILKQYGIESVYLKISVLTSLMLLLKSKLFLPVSLSWVHSVLRKNYFERFLDDLDVDLLYFTSPSIFPKYVYSYNFIYTLWDLSHRDDVEFPEIRNYFGFEKREILLNAILPKATAILVDSNLGKENVTRRYGVDDGRVLVMPFSPAESVNITNLDYEENFIDIKNKYKIEHDYIFYPAQFWAHKNHIYILKGIIALEKRYDIKINAVFSGSNKGNKKYILEVAERMGLDDRIIFTGFVPNIEIPYLYRQSIALVMPSYFGPTNLPPMEAFQLGVPVIYGNIGGSEEQLGDAVHLVDLYDENSFVDAVIALQNETTREGFIEKGYSRLKYINEKRSLAEESFKTIIKKYQIRKQCWSM